YPSDPESSLRAIPMRSGLIGLLLVAILVSFSTNLRAQGRVTFSNLGGPGLTNFLTGMPWPAGTTFRAQLYYAPDGETNLQQFIPLDPPTTSLLPGGFISAGSRTTPTSTAPGDFALFQIRFWETAFGFRFDDVACTPTKLGGRGPIIAVSNVLRI